MVHLTDANEAAEFQAPSKDQTTLYIAEDGTTPAEGPGLATSASAAPGAGTAEFVYLRGDGPRRTR